MTPTPPRSGPRAPRSRPPWRRAPLAFALALGALALLSAPACGLKPFTLDLEIGYNLPAVGKGGSPAAGFRAIFPVPARLAGDARVDEEILILFEVEDGALVPVRVLRGGDVRGGPPRRGEPYTLARIAWRDEKGDSVYASAPDLVTWTEVTALASSLGFESGVTKVVTETCITKAGGELTCARLRLKERLARDPIVWR